MGDQKNPPPPSTSPNSTSTSTSSNGNPSSSLPPLTPKSNPNPNNPYPTTFVQADTHSFKQVVQMLTGSSDTAAATKIPPNSPSFPKSSIPPISRTNKKPAFKLYERRGSMKNLKMISPLIPSFSAAAVGRSPREKHAPEILSPSILDFPLLALSPVTPLSPDPFNRSPNLSMSVEDRAIAERGFYLHPSPRATTPMDSEPPKLLPLFPLS